jgi:hypothetical protein
MDVASQRVRLRSAIAKAVRYWGGFSLHQGRFSILCAPDECEYVLMPDQNRSGIVSEAIDAPQMVPKDTNRILYLGVQVREHGVDDKKVGNLIVGGAVHLVV